MRKLIYLVEDNDEISELIEYLLSDCGFHIIPSISVSGLKKNLKDTLPDLIILDIMLPDGNGIEMCKELKSDQTTNYIPVLLMSAHVNIELNAMASGANGFISKPFDIDDFVTKVQLQMA